MASNNYNIDDYIDFQNYALIKNSSTKVITIINVPPAFSSDGFYLVKVESGVYCQNGMFYDSATKLFYDDEAFTSINGIAVRQSDSSGQIESTA